MADPEYLCGVCNVAVDISTTACNQCLTRFEAVPFVEKTPPVEPEVAATGADAGQSADKDNLEQCPRPGCAGSLQGAECMLCQLPAFIRYELPFEGATQELHFGDSVQLGRSKGPFAERLSNYPNISGCHCELRFESSYPVVVDIKSLNGTYLNGTEVPRGTEGVRLKPPAVLRLGRDNSDRGFEAVEIRVLS